MARPLLSSDDKPSPSIQTALGDIVTRGHQLLVNRLDLMQVELREVGERAVKRAVDVALGMLLTFSGFVLLTAAAVMGLAHVMGSAWALTLCGGVYALGGIILMVVAKKTPAIDLTTSIVPAAGMASKESRHE